MLAHLKTYELYSWTLVNKQDNLFIIILKWSRREGNKKCLTPLKLDRKKCLRVLGRVQTLSEPNVSNHENSGMNTSTLIQRTSLTTISGLKILEAVSKETRTRDLNGIS